MACANGEGCEGVVITYVDGCPDIPVRDGNTVILPCPLHQEDICLHRLQNVDVTVENPDGVPLVWDPASCTTNLGPTWCDIAKDLPAATDPTLYTTSTLLAVAADGSCVRLPPLDPCALLGLIPRANRNPNVGELVLGMDINGACVWFTVGDEEAVDDVDPIERTSGVAFNIDVSPNDTPCVGAATQWRYIPGSQSGCVVHTFISANGVFNVTASCVSGAAAINDTDLTVRAPGDVFTVNVAANDTVCNDGVWSFRYELFCDGQPTGSTATVSGTVSC
jgi:hypothetical protein